MFSTLLVPMPISGDVYLVCIYPHVTCEVPSFVHEPQFQVLSTLCGSEEILGSESGRNVLSRCLADAFSDGESIAGAAGA